MKIRALRPIAKAHSSILLLVVAFSCHPAVGANSVAFSNSKTIAADCEAVWPAMLSVMTANGFVPVLSDKAGGVLKANYTRGESLWGGAKKDMNALTLNRFSGWTVVEKFRVQDVVGMIAPAANGCVVSMHVQFATLLNNLLQKGWFALESSGRLEWMMLAETEHATAGRALVPQDKNGREVRPDQVGPAAKEQSEPPKGIVVRFTSTPPESEVLIDGEYWGSTPTSDLNRRPAGPHTIIVKKLGYQPWERKITLAPGDDRTINAELEPPPIDPTKPRIVGNN
jgi:hypothetical protein